MEKEFISHVTGAMKKWPSPGPAAYEIKRKFKKQCPPVKMRGRHADKQEVLKAPYYNLKAKFGDVPAVGMHVRPQTKNDWRPPGPSYVPPKFGSNAVQVRIAPPRATKMRAQTPDGKGTSLQRRRTGDETIGPGPGKYSTRREEFGADGKRGLSILGHHDFNYDTGLSPGPSAYKPKYEKVLPAAPKPGMRIRPKAKDAESTAGYRNLGSTLGGPKYSMKRREQDDIYLV